MKDFTDMAMVAARLATGRMGWSPERFWRATAAEFRTAMEGALGISGGEPPLSGVDLTRLKERFPDG